MPGNGPCCVLRWTTCMKGMCVCGGDTAISCHCMPCSHCPRGKTMLFTHGKRSGDSVGRIDPHHPTLSQQRTHQTCDPSTWPLPHSMECRVHDWNQGLLHYSSANASWTSHSGGMDDTSGTINLFDYFANRTYPRLLPPVVTLNLDLLPAPSIIHWNTKLDIATIITWVVVFIIAVFVILLLWRGYGRKIIQCCACSKLWEHSPDSQPETIMLSTLEKDPSSVTQTDEVDDAHPSAPLYSFK